MTDVTERAGDIHVLEDTDMTPRNQDTDGDGFDGERFGNVMTKAYNVIKETGRGNDFLSLITEISNGQLEPHHIALHLLLDVGNFLPNETVYNMRYTDVTLDFWSCVYRLFKGKATRFFRGPMSYKADMIDGKTRGLSASQHRCLIMHCYDKHPMTLI